MKRLLPFYILLLGLSCAAQNSDQLWGSYFSYYNVVDMAQSATRVFSASESAMFYQNTATGELNTITSIDGFKPESITVIYHSTSTGRTLVGNVNGLLIIVNNDGSVVNKIDIVQEATVAANKKRINHISEYNGVAYIATNYGVSAFNIATLEFIDTYYLGPNGAEIGILQSAAYNGYLYVITESHGVRRGLLSNPNLNDFSQWEVPYPDGMYYTMAEFNGTLFLTNAWTIYRILPNGTIGIFHNMPDVVTDLRVCNNTLVATCPGNVSAFNNMYVPIFQINTVGEPAVFVKAVIVGGKLYVGTTDKGVFSIDTTNFGIENITPAGPLLNRIFTLEKSPSNLWVAFGGYNSDNVPDSSTHGVSRLTPEGWVSIAYEDLFNARSISDIAINPTNENEVYLLSFGTGLVRVIDGVATTLFTDGNGLEHEQHDNTSSTRVVGGAYDRNNRLWMMNTRTEEPLKTLNGTSWNSYSFEDVVPPTQNQEYNDMAIDRNGTKWIASSFSGLVVYNEALSNKYIVVNTDSGLTSNKVNCVAIDANNRVWVGTTDGLRTISSIERFVTDNVLNANNIVIMEDGLPQELLFEQNITDIRVDGSNNKWIGTGAGAFLVTADGQSTLYHFTKENSPLPSNIINDIEIDDATGEVYFATDKGLVSFKGTSTRPEGDLNNVYVYPNPVRPGFEGDVKISGLMDNVNIKVTDIEGNLVYETTSEGGTVLWDTRAFGKYKVASGVYMIFISSDDGTQTKVKKVMIVRGN
jgi:hypothetical protein